MLLSLFVVSSDGVHHKMIREYVCCVELQHHQQYAIRYQMLLVVMKLNNVLKFDGEISESGADSIHFRNAESKPKPKCYCANSLTVHIIIDSPRFVE